MNPGNQGFWAKLKKPMFVLAPMADVTDPAFRRMFAKYGKPDVTWTEFVSADGLIRATEVGKKKLMRDLLYTEAERPIIAQLFSSHPEYMKQAAALVRELGFDGIDINMGCPDRSIEKQGAGAAMIRNPALAREVIRAAQEGAQTHTGGIPVSVKTRIGYNKNELETWLPEILKENPAAVTIHARTRKEMSLVPARWEHVKRAVEIRDELQKDLPEKTLILGNGDVKDLNDARQKCEETGADGAMLGRAIFGNPWRFNKDIDIAHVSIHDRLTAMVEHTKLFMELLGDIKSFAVMKKHYKAYVNNFDGAAELRAKLMETNNEHEVEQIVGDFLTNISK
ncbi:MAG: tRNA-dihydrouridine synthase [Patescibacteria group bacterium]